MTLRGSPHRLRIGVDIGGTFTDIVLASSDGRLATAKRLTTPDDFGRGIAEGIAHALEQADARPGDVERVVHGTTVATNAILEHRGALTALVTTAGFRDVLEMRRLRIPEMYALNYPRPDPLVPRRLRLEVEERTGPRGEIWKPLDPATVHAVADRLAAAGVEAVAVSFLHAYANPSHEREAVAILRERLGDAVFICCGSDVLPVIREYERTSTTVINAFLGPTLRRYFASLSRHLASIGITAPIHVMKSDGGVMTLAAAAERPAWLVESGPAAGVIGVAANLVGQSSGDAITFDMGGTTAKVSLIENGAIQRTGDYEVGAGINLSSKLVMGGGYALKVPVIDISEVGAGGGSLVTIDAGGLPRVGPRSAGAMPGPVCYGRGGTQATFTDAALTLGFLNPEAIAGGGLALDAAAGRQAVHDQVAGPLRLGDPEAAWGVLQVACATMVRAVKAVSTYRGRDPREFALHAFGGNGPLVAIEIARMLDMRRVVIPPNPGVFSAWGLLCARLEHEIARTHLVRLAETDARDLGVRLAELEGTLAERMQAEGHGSGNYAVRHLADLRYAGQAHELTVPLGSPPDLAALAAAFAAEHERTYGHQSGSVDVECVTLRVVAHVHEAPPARSVDTASKATAEVRVRKVYFGPAHGMHDTRLVTRSHLRTAPQAGPLVVEEFDATCVVPPDWSAALDVAGNIVLTANG